MNQIYLERHDLDKNLHRFYQIFVIPGLFGEWSLVRGWGKDWLPETVRKDWFDTEPEAASAAKKLLKEKQRKGYRTSGKELMVYIAVIS
ncbi:WGR domain-containing protein [Methylomarinum sp. Ch1-1]|uniref:WGR domain-containing protein n=1 Tax=Methylomarinum roseum TaxID=3067653 RepID=A0AAU7NYC8_9GAMM|nr:WGR domain-containing protein [Methylomarinum sp. Ch1-1]MDP4521939.1 WGR domain-containing protein [Methylomarinum sp. Ch1-1]